ncbi:MAG: class I SAM-dependent methyltransferase [Methylococcales bacterium]
MNDDSRHNYEYEVDLHSDSAPARVIRMVGADKSVLEIGAGPGSITKHLKLVGNCKVVALEIDEDAIPKLEPFCDAVYRADLNDSTWPSLLDGAKFDTIVAADVLEHVYDPWSTLEAMRRLLKDDGNIVISLPHVGHSAVVACLLDEDFDYRDWGLLDRTHIRFFGLKNMQALFNNAGLNISEAQFVIVNPEDSEFAPRWKKLPLDVRKTLSSFRHGNIYQVVIKAVPIAQSADNIDLMSIPVDKVNSSGKADIKSFLKICVPAKYRANLRSLARKIGLNG